MSIKYFILPILLFLSGCNSAKKPVVPCCPGLGIDLSILIGSEGVDCGQVWTTNYWWHGARKNKNKIEQRNKKALACVNNAQKAGAPYIYQYSCVSFPDGGYDYYAISTKEGKNVLVVYGSVGDEPVNYYIGYCDTIGIKQDGSLGHDEKTCSPTTDMDLYEKVRIK